MANSKVTGLTSVTDLFGDDVLYVVDGASADGKVLVGDFNLLPDGYLWNGKIQVTVSSNNLTVALKTRQGNNPSSGEPVSVHIGGTRRRCTASLSVTKNAGTNWCNAGSTEMAGNEIDFFVYLGWNTTPATDIVDIAFSRVPYGRLYSDFSGTTTNEKYLAFGNASTPNAADEWVCVGRFAATLSASPNFNWSVPTFTNANLIQHPIDRTRWLSYSPQVTPSSGSITTLGTVTGNYRVHTAGFDFEHSIGITTNGTGSGILRATLPFTPASVSQIGKGRENNSTGNMLQILFSSNLAQYTTYSNSYPGGSGFAIRGSAENVRLV